jgi:DNA (cytosine-5)-methyltransferase 1
MTDYNYLDLFAGIGGFALGAYMVGMRFKNHLCSEIDPWCQKLYQKRFPDSVQLGDITKIDTDDLKNKYGSEWIITGGFPCQDISIAGKGKGLIDENGNKTRSGLWFEYWRIIRDLRPRFAIMENVAALSFRGLNTVLGSLAEIFYDAEGQLISAADMGAPHKRERIWIVAYPSSKKSESRNRSEGKTSYGERVRIESCTGCQEDVADASEPGLSQSQTEKQQERLLYAKRGSSEIPDSLIQHDDNSGHGTSEIFRERSCETEIQGQLSDSERIRLRGKRTEYDTAGQTGLRYRKTGWPASLWKFEPTMGCMVDGLPPGMDGYEGRLATKSYERVNQLKGLGNSIVPKIAQILFEQIKPLL